MVTSNFSTTPTLLCYVSPMNLYQLLLNGFLTFTTVVVGIIGNIYSIGMVGKFRIGKAPMYYLVSLAMWDIGVLCCTFCYYVLKNLLDTLGLRWIWLPYLVYFSHGPLMTSTTGSVWTTVAITVSRYGAISNPFRSRVSASLTKTKIVCLLIVLGTLVYCMPCYFEIFVNKCLDNASGEIIPEILPTKLRADHTYLLIYRMIMYMMFVTLAPFLIILSLSIHMIIILRRSALLEAQCSPHLYSNAQRTLVVDRRRKTKQAKTSRLFVVLFCKFLICYLLPTGLMVSEAVIGPVIYSNAFVLILADISNFVVVLNSATNFSVYFWWKRNYGSTKRGKRKLTTTIKLNDTLDNSAENTLDSPRRAIPMTASDTLFRFNTLSGRSSAMSLDVL